MSFTGDYLQKHAFRGPLIDTAPQDNLHCVVIIPAYKEPGLNKSLGSLFLCSPPGVHVEVIVLINAPEDADEASLAMNAECYQQAVDWQLSHQRDDLSFHILRDNDLPKKHAGVGLARKILMDEAVRRLDAAGNSQGIVLSFDADAFVDEGYLAAVVEHFADPKVSGCSISFEHPLDEESGRVGEWESEEVYAAIANYELHMRYYLHAVRYTGYPYAYYTVGSSFAVRANTYCSQGGMNKRQAGEDFYFIQKMAQIGSWSDCTSTTVHPSPRPSDRVVFGTGPDIIKQLEHPGTSYMTYNPELFEMIRDFFAYAAKFFGEEHALHIYKNNNLLGEYLEETRYGDSIDEIRRNASSEKTFTARFFRHFNMLWILKFLHWAEEPESGRAGEPESRRLEVGAAGREMLERLGYNCTAKDVKGILEYYRKIDRTSI